MKHTWLAALALSPLLTLAPGCSCNQGADAGDEARPPGDPGRVTLRRLNRSEYDNTVRDLLGTSLRPAQDFPYDDTSFGFDNVADTLSVSPLHVEMYEAAASRLATEATELPLEELYDVAVMAESPEITATTGGAGADHYNLWSNGELHAPIDVPAAGLYELTARLYGDQGGPDLVLAGLGVDGQLVESFSVAAGHRDEAETHAVEVELTPGPHTITVFFLNDYYDPDAGVDRNLRVDWVAALGPLDAEPGPNPVRERLYTCDPGDIGEEACARQILGQLAPRAWRRPLGPGELDALVDLFLEVTGDGGTFDDGLRVAITRVLLSPHFLFRVELDPNPGSAEPAPLSDHELASRLSYFLWSSMPDEELFAAADAGLLQDDAEIERQVRRMLADPKAAALTDDFAGQWLYIRGIDNMAPDVWAFPDFDAELRASMKEEMRRFFASFVASDRSMTELLTATHGEIDARLAAHYEVAAPSAEWGEVDLSRVERGGVLGQAGLHLVTSYPTRTSPVLRGKWVLSQLLCSEPDPPPPGVEGLIEDEADPQTVRERLEQHRADPVCASCHDVMDPLGFAFEHFDGVGAWRDAEHGFPVDALGELPDGRSFYGTAELGQVLADEPLFGECVSEKLFTWALGRAPVPADAPFLTDIHHRFVDADLRFADLAVAIATSAPFRMRRGEP